MTITVMIATRNRAQHLGEVLESLAKQETHAAFTYEVLVVDNGSSDGTSEVVAQKSQRYPVPLRYVREARRGKPFALNTGMAQARGGILAHTDDDVVAEPSWLFSLWRCFQETGADGVAGKIVPRWVDGRPQWLTDRVMRRFGTFGCLDLGPTRIVMSESEQPWWWVGGNLAFRKALINRVGGVDERRLHGEDAELFRRYRDAGATIVYEPTAVVQHKIGRERLTPAYFRQWHRRAGYYRAYDLGWRPHHVVSLMPLYGYRELLRWAYRWAQECLTRQNYWLRLGAECRMRGWWSMVVHRLQLWPRGMLSVITPRSFRDA